MKRRPQVTVCVAITADGKLDSTGATAPAVWSLPGDIPFDPSPGESDADHLRRLTAQNSAKRVVCRGGSEQIRRLLDEDLVGGLSLLVRPIIDGRRGAVTLSGMPGEYFAASIRLRLVSMEVRGDECVLHYRVRRGRAKQLVAA